MLIAPASSALKESFIASPLKCSRGFGKLAMVIVEVTAPAVPFPTDFLSVIDFDDSQIVPFCHFPPPIPGRIRQWAEELRWDGSKLYNLTISDTSLWHLDPNQDGTWRWTKNTLSKPTPQAQEAYHPRAYRTNSGLHSVTGEWPYATKIKVFGACWGTLCQYAAAFYDSAEDIGFVDDEMLRIAPSEHSEIAQNQSQSFEFTAIFPPLPKSDDHLMNAPSIAIFWPGMRPIDFPWYRSTGHATVTNAEGPKTTD